MQLRGLLQPASGLAMLAMLVVACSPESAAPVEVPSGDATPTTSSTSQTPAPRPPSGATASGGTRATETTTAAATATATPTTTPTTAPAVARPPLTATTARAPTATPSSGPGGQTVGLECVAPVLKRHPIDLAPYDASTGHAGDAFFVRPLFLNRVFTEFGFVIPAATTSTGNDKANPQPTYLAPMGTKVHSAVDGVVDRIADLWSTPTLGDVSVMVKPDGLQGHCYVVVEFEHVVNPTVRAGDRVTAGQEIAEVGPLNSQGSQGLGLVEFGILTGSGDGRPLHVCPYAYFDPAVRRVQLEILGRFLADWESYAGDTTLYNEGAWTGGVTGCRSDPIKE